LGIQLSGQAFVLCVCAERAERRAARFLIVTRRG
jgi:hypothetical protein